MVLLNLITVFSIFLQSSWDI